MIAVIADDFTGAAELGGIGLRHRLATEIGMTVNTATDADLLVIAADTRSMGQAAAVAEMEKVALQLKALRPEWIYKKVDSVLRGHVVPEINALLKVLELQSALLAPANPFLGRTIEDGHYFFNGLPVHQSAFSHDPEFAITSSDVRDMLRAPVAIRKATEELPGTGIVIGEVRDAGDLQAWSRRMGPNMLAAGASGFFSAILATRLVAGNRVITPRPPGRPVLLVSGTTFGSSRTAIRQLFDTGGPVCYMTPDDRWWNKAIALLGDGGKAVVAIGAGGEEGPGYAAQLRAIMAKGVRQILDRVKIEELIIEGGATAYAILRESGFGTFFPEEELAPGVIRMRAAGSPGLYITVKPGSYPWPESINY